MTWAGHEPLTHRMATSPSSRTTFSPHSGHVAGISNGAAPGGRFGRLWGGGYVLVAHKSRHLVLPLRLRALPVATRGRPLSPGVRLGLAA